MPLFPEFPSLSDGHSLQDLIDRHRNRAEEEQAAVFNGEYTCDRCGATLAGRQVRCENEFCSASHEAEFWERAASRFSGSFGLSRVDQGLLRRIDTSDLADTWRQISNRLNQANRNWGIR